MYSKVEVLAELNKLSWSLPEKFKNNQKDSVGNYLLFRGHDRFEDDITLHQGLIHLTPFFNIAASLFRFKLSLNYINFPPNYFFISVYTGGKNNKFYPDETLEEVFTGKKADMGVAISDILTFDESKHFETQKHDDNKKITTYLLKFENPLRKDSAKIAEISDVLKQMLQANKKIDTKQMIAIAKQDQKD